MVLIHINLVDSALPKVTVSIAIQVSGLDGPVSSECCIWYGFGLTLIMAVGMPGHIKTVCYVDHQHKLDQAPGSVCVD